WARFCQASQPSTTRTATAAAPPHQDLALPAMHDLRDQKTPGQGPRRESPREATIAAPAFGFLDENVAGREVMCNHGANGAFAARLWRQSAHPCAERLARPLVAFPSCRSRLHRRQK